MTGRTGPTLPAAHALLALAVVAVWGSNFVVIKFALDALPPLTLACLRFALAWLPAALLVRRPAVPWRELAAYGVLIGGGQFGLLFIAMTQYISPGLASLTMQTQVFFTIGLAMWLSGERPLGVQWLALLLAAVGIGVIAANTDATTTATGLALTLAAAACWAAGNMVARRAPGANMLGYMVWSSMFAVPPLAAMALLLEGPPAIAAGLGRADAAVWAAVAWQSVGNTLFGFGAWAWLLARHPAATVSPLALLIPVFGMAASALLLGEPLPGWKLLAAGLVIAALALNLLGPRVRALVGRR